MKISAARLNTVVSSMEAHTSGKYAQLDTFACSSYIGWLFKFKKLPEDEIDFLIKWMTAIFERNHNFLDELETEYGQQWIAKLKSHKNL